MKYLHTMVRVHDLDASLGFYRDLLGLVETGRYESEEGEFTLVFLAAPEDLDRSKAERAPLIELTYNWDGEVYQGGRNFGHLAFAVDNVYAFARKRWMPALPSTCRRATATWRFSARRTISRSSCCKKANPLPPAEPWVSMQTTGEW